MKVYILFKDYGYNGGLDAKGVYGSPREARDAAREHAVEYCAPKPALETVTLEWKPVNADLGGDPLQAAALDGYRFEIHEFDLALTGTAEADAAILMLARDILKQRMPLITSDARGVLEHAASFITAGEKTGT